MFNIGPEKLVLLAAIALIVLGPNRLPQAARTFGRVVAEFRRVSGTVHAEVNDVLREPREIFNEALREPRQAVQEHRDSIAGMVGGLKSYAQPFAPDHGSQDHGSQDHGPQDQQPPAEAGQDSGMHRSGATAVSIPHAPPDPSLN